MALLDIDWNPPHRQLRLFAVLQLAFCLLIAWWLLPVQFGVIPRVVLSAVSLAVALLGLARPAALRIVWVIWMAAVFPIGWLISHILMAAVYFLVVTPIGLALRLCGHDPMGRKRDQATSTYWKPRKPESDVKRYFRPF